MFYKCPRTKPPTATTLNLNREWNELLEEQEKEDKKAEAKMAKAASAKPVVVETKVEVNIKTKKLTFNEKKEFEALEKDIPSLEAEKVRIESKLASGILSSDEIVKASHRFGELGELIDDKTMRWLELSEM